MHLWENIQGLFSLNTAISLALLIALAIVLALAKRAFRGYLKRIGADEDFDNPKGRVARLVYTFVRYALIFVVFVSILGVHGINLTAIAAAAGAAGIVLGFALQDILNDLAMGLRIVADGYFSVGQTIRVGEVEGVVMSISPQSTKVKSIVDDSVTTFSNRLLTQVKVLNPLVDVDVPLPYNLAASEAQRVLEQAVDRIKAVEGVSDAAFVGTQAFGESSVLYRVRLWCEPPRRYQVMRDVRRIIQDVIADNGLNIPYPQIDVHMN